MSRCAKLSSIQINISSSRLSFSSCEFSMMVSSACTCLKWLCTFPPLFRNFHSIQDLVCVCVCATKSHWIFFLSIVTIAYFAIILIAFWIETTCTKTNWESPLNISEREASEKTSAEQLAGKREKQMIKMSQTKKKKKKRFNSMRFKEISTNCFHRSIDLRHTSWEREAACWSDVCLFSGFIFGNAQTCDNVSTQSLFKFVKTWLCTMSRASVSRILYWWILNGIHDRIIKNNWWQ